MNSPFAHFTARPFRALPRVGTSLLLLCALSAQAKQADAPLTLRMTYKAGDVHKTKASMVMNFSFDLPGQDKPMTQTVDSRFTQQQKTLSVTPEGVATIVTTTLSSEIIANGKTTPGPEIKPITTTMDSRGHLISVKGMPEAKAGMPDFSKIFGNGFTGAFLPENPVKPGDTWTQKLSLPTLTSGDAKTTSTFVRTETIGTHQTALIHFTGAIPMAMKLTDKGSITENADEAAMTMTGTMNMAGDVNSALEDGRILQQTSTADAVLTMHVKQPQQGQPESIKISLKMKMFNKSLD